MKISLYSGVFDLASLLEASCVPRGAPGGEDQLGVSNTTLSVLTEPEAGLLNVALENYVTV